MKNITGKRNQEPAAVSWPAAVRFLCLVIIPLSCCAAGCIPFILSINPVYSVLSLLVMFSFAGISLWYCLRQKELSGTHSHQPGLLLSAILIGTIMLFVCALLLLNTSFEVRVLLMLSLGGVVFVTGVTIILFYRLSGIKSSATPFFKFVVNSVEALFLLAAASFMYSLSFPGFLNEWGVFPFGFIALIPVFTLIHRMRLRYTPIAGIFFGIFAHFLLNYWLAMFHPLAIIVALTYRAIFFGIVFFVLKAVIRFFPRWGFIFQCVIWVAYEYLTSLGFSGYEFGLMGYSQYLFLPLLQSASLGGVWLVSFVVVFPAAFIAAICKNGLRGIALLARRKMYAGFGFIVVFIVLLVFGMASQKNYDAYPVWKAALIQSNTDPWQGGDAVYESSLRILINQSEKAVKKNPDIVVWSETALVPSVRFHARYRYDLPRYNRVVKPFLEFMDTQKIPYVTGNVDGVLAGRKNNGDYIRKDYNAAILFNGREIKGVYRKTHLVPFTEHFPFADLFPSINQWLLNADTHFWEKGDESDTRYVFESNGVKFSTPICFEDNFGYLTREFVRNGAEVIVNITNDAWSKSVAELTQHLGIAVFRSVETRRSSVRSATSGITAGIDPNGKILSMAEPMKETFLVAEVPVVNDETTLYTLWGDWFGLLCSVLTGLLIIAGAGITLIKKTEMEAHPSNDNLF